MGSAAAERAPKRAPHPVTNLKWGPGGAPPHSPGGPTGRWGGRCHQAAQLCGSQGWVIDGPSTAASVSRAHVPICHLYWGGQGWGLLLHPPPSLGVVLFFGEPRALSWNQPPPPSPCGPSRAADSYRPAGQPLSAPCMPWPRSCCPPTQGPFQRTALCTPLAVPMMGMPTQCLGPADITACSVQRPKASREDGYSQRLPSLDLLNPLGSRASVCVCVSSSVSVCGHVWSGV